MGQPRNQKPPDTPNSSSLGALGSMVKHPEVVAEDLTANK